MLDRRRTAWYYLGENENGGCCVMNLIKRAFKVVFEEVRNIDMAIQYAGMVSDVELTEMQKDRLLKCWSDWTRGVQHS